MLLRSGYDLRESVRLYERGLQADLREETQASEPFLEALRWQVAELFKGLLTTNPAPAVKPTALAGQHETKKSVSRAHAKRRNEKRGSVTRRKPVADALGRPLALSLPALQSH